MPLVLFGRVVRIARKTPGAYVPPVTGYRDVAFVWDSVSGADTYKLEISADLVTWVEYYSGAALSYTASVASGTKYKRVKAWRIGTPPSVLIATTDPEEFSV